MLYRQVVYRVKKDINKLMVRLENMMVFDAVSFHVFIRQITVKVGSRKHSLAGSDNIISLKAATDYMVISWGLFVRMKCICVAVHVLKPV